MDSITAFKPEAPTSPALGFAVACGLPLRMSYSLSETARYTGVSEHLLSRAIRDGELDARVPNGNLRGVRIPVRAVDAFMGYV